MAELLFYPILIVLLLLQTTIVRSLPLFNGTVDLLLLWIIAWGLQDKGKNVWIGAVFAGLILGFASEIPWYVDVLSYLFVALVSRFFIKRFWNNPLIAMIIVTFIGGFVFYTTQFAGSYIIGTVISINSAIKYVMIPSMLLNLLFAIPILALVSDMAKWVYPIEVGE